MSSIRFGLKDRTPSPTGMLTFANFSGAECETSGVPVTEMIFSPGFGHLNQVAGELGLLGGVFGSKILSLSALVALGLGAGVLNFDRDAWSAPVTR